MIILGALSHCIDIVWNDHILHATGGHFIEKNKIDYILSTGSLYRYCP
jgi:hypothetical protein